MKDWKAECDKLKGEMSELRKQLEYERQWRESRTSHDEDLKNTFKKLLLDVLSD